MLFRVEVGQRQFGLAQDDGNAPRRIGKDR